MMDLWKLRTLPRPKSLTAVKVPVGLARGVVAQVDRRRLRMTPAVVANHWTWRNTPPWRNTPLARTTPWPTTTPRQSQSANMSVYTASHFSSSRAAPSTISVTSINSLTSNVDAKKQSKEIEESTTDAMSDSSDVTEMDVTNDTNGNIISTTSRKPVLPSSHSTVSNYSTISSATSSHHLTPTSSHQQSDVIGQNHVTSVSRDSLSRLTYVTAPTSQHGATSGTRDDTVSGGDVKARNADVEASSDGQVSAGEMTTYLTGDAEVLSGNSSDDTQVRHGQATPLNDAIQVTSDAGKAANDQSGVFCSSSSELVTCDVTSTSTNRALVIANDVMPQSSTDVNKHSVTSSQSVLGRLTNTRGSASKLTSTLRTSSSANWSAVTVKETGRGRRVTSLRREPSVRTSSFAERATSTSSSSDDAFSLWPRGVLLKSANSTDSGSTICWSSQFVIPLLTVAVVLALCLLVISVACAVRYARKYCCCLAPRAGSYTPSPSPRDHTAGKPAAGNKRQPRRVDRPREQAVTKPTSRLVETEPAYRSVVIIGSDRFARRAIPTKDPPRRHWIVRNRTSTWGNLSQLTNDTLPLPPPPPPPPLPSQTIVLARSPVDDDVGGRTVPAIVSQLEGRLNVAAQIHNSQPQLYIK